MIQLTIAFALVCLCVIAVFVWQLRRIRTRHPIANHCVAKLESVREEVALAGVALKAEIATAADSLKGEMTSAEIDARVTAAKSREPKSDVPETVEMPVLPVKRDGKLSAPVVTLLVAALVGVSYYWGGEMRERLLSHPAARAGAGVTPAAPSVDSKLAELRDRPEAAVYFKYCPINPERRSEVIAALRGVDTVDAKCALTRWEN